MSAARPSPEALLLDYAAGGASPAIGLLVATHLSMSTQGRELFAMMEAIGGVESSVRSAIELQVRYFLAAMAAGAIDDEISEEDLRGMFASQAGEMRENVRLYSVLNSAYAYRDVTDQDMTDYVAALEHPKMRQVYEILNAIQFEIMAERYERLAAALADLHPQQDI